MKSFKVGDLISIPVYQKEKTVYSICGMIVKDLTKYSSWIANERAGVFQVLWFHIPDSILQNFIKNTFLHKRWFTRRFNNYFVSAYCKRYKIPMEEIVYGSEIEHCKPVFEITYNGFENIHQENEF